MSEQRAPVIVYLSGPMSGIEGFNYAAFDRWAETLRAEGYDVINPAENFDGADTHPEGRKAFMRLDIEHVLRADAIVVLPGWQRSKGALLEVAIARELELAVLDVTTMEPFTETAVAEAGRLVHGDRGGVYGHPIDDFTRTGRIWASVLSLDDVSAEQVALCMMAVKISRLCASPDHRDSVVDIAGYAETLSMVQERRTAS